MKYNNKLLRVVFLVMVLLLTTAMLLVSVLDNGARCIYYMISGSIIFFAVLSVLVEFDINLLKRTRKPLNTEKLHISRLESQTNLVDCESRNLRYDILTHELYVYSSDGLNQVLLYENMPESISEIGIVSKEYESEFEEFFKSMLRGDPRGRCIVNVNNNIEDSNCWKSYSFVLIRDIDGKPESGLIVERNITRQRERDLAYHRWINDRSKYSDNELSLYEYNLTTGEFNHREGQLNVGFGNCCGGDYECCVNRYVKHCVYREDKDMLNSALMRDNLIAAFRDGKRPTGIEYRVVTKNGIRWVRLDFETIMHSGSSDICVYLLFIDVDSQKRSEMQLKQKAEQDSLTHCYNRNAFSDKVTNILMESEAECQHGLIMIDVDNFKAVNDIYGHITGDKLLVYISDCIKSCVRSNDIVCRLGGDEFILFLCDVKSDETVIKKARQICDAVHLSVRNVESVSVSLGAALFPRDGRTLHELYDKADKALYCSKNNGKNCFVMYEHSMLDGYNVETNSVAADIHKPHIIIIADEDKETRQIVHQACNDRFTIYETSDGDELLGWMDMLYEDIAVVIMDIAMSGLNGYDVLNRVVNTPKLRNIPILAIEQFEDSDSKFKAIRLGAIDCISKPLDLDTVKKSVDAAVAMRDKGISQAYDSYLMHLKAYKVRYGIIMEESCIVSARYDIAKGIFKYDRYIRRELAGTYDGRAIWDIFKNDNVSCAKDAGLLESIIKRKLKDKSYNPDKLTIRLKTSNNERHWFDIRITELDCKSDGVGELFITLRDIQCEKDSGRRLRELEERDILTGLCNRQCFIETIELFVKSEPAGTYVLAYFDIKDFKIYNDLYGHAEGDKLLRYIAVYARKAVVNERFCCRISSDHFAIIYQNTQSVAERMHNLRLEAIKAFNIAYDIHIDFGLYVINDITISVEHMIDCASLALDNAKKRYDTNVVMYDDEMHRRFVRSRKIINEMDLALEEGQFDAYIQPQFDYNSKTMTGAEALVRWIHPDEGVIAPNEFVPIFEENGFITKLDEYIFSLSCKRLGQWIRMGLEPVPMSVNLSRIDLYDKDFVDNLHSIAERHNVPTELLHLEITESAMVHKPEQLIDTIYKLRNEGFIIEMDDFGSGYSSLNSLSDIPVDVIKLDMMFIAGSDELNRRKQILHHIIAMANEMGLSVIAEGVEQREQAKFLQEIGCNHMQGYYFAKPMNIRDYEQMLLMSHRRCKKPEIDDVFQCQNINA